MDDEPRIYMRHARALNLCAKGVARQAERLGISMQDFCDNGYPCRLADNSSNPFMRKASALARAEWEKAHGEG